MLAQVQAERARRSGSRDLRAFVKEAWPIVDPSPLVWGWHMDAICDHLQALARGHIKRLIINIAPRHSKSTLFSILWPAWMWTSAPSEQFFFLSYAAELSVEHSVKCRQVIESAWYRERFSPSWALKADQNVKHDFQNTANGRRFATSIGGSLTGKGGDIVAIDDPLNAKDAHSAAKREEARRTVDEVIATRLNDRERGRAGLIMQRLHADDPTGHLLRQGGWEHLCLASEFDPERRARTFVDMGAGREPFWQDPREEAGEPLFPARFSAEVLAEIKRTLGPDAYAGQHGQTPAPPGGGMFKVAAWRFWKPDGSAPDQATSRPRGCYEGPARPLPARFGRVIVSVDATFKETVSGSFVAIHVWGAEGPDRFLLDRVHRRMDFDATCQALVSVCAKWPRAREKFIEEKANGAAIISALQRKIPGFQPVNPEGGKEARAAAAQPYQAGGNIFLPDGAPWLAEYIEEHAAFPNGPTNDDVDAQSQAILALEAPLTTASIWARASR